jgi:hypothetical protein
MEQWISIEKAVTQGPREALAFRDVLPTDRPNRQFIA